VANLILPSRFNQQPQGAVATTERLLWTPHYPFTSSGATREVSASGVGISTGTTVAINYAELKAVNDLSPVVPRTYLIHAKSNGTSSNEYPRIFGCLNSTGSTNNTWSFGVFPNNTLYFEYRAGATQYYVLGTRALKTTPETVIVTVSNGTLSLYLDGILNATLGSTTLPTAHASYPIRIGHQPDASLTPAGYPATVYLAAVIDGVVRNVAELTRNPWQLFKKRPQILYFDVGGGATDYPTAADSSSFAITGSAANGVSARVGTADASSYTITGSDANGAKSVGAAAESGSYLITGVAANGTSSKVSAADPSSIVVTGPAANATWARVATAESSTYTVTGSDANAIRALVSAANSSSYVITGSDAQGVKPTVGDTPSAAGSSSYAITGSDSLGTQAFVSAANSGSYVITGVDALASKSIQAIAESGSYTITGSDTSITRTFASEANSSSYVIEVGTANGVYSGEPTTEILGAGSSKRKKKTKQYLVDGVLRELTDEQVAQIMYEAVQQPKKIVLEDKPEPLDVPEELKKKSIFRPENLEKPKKTKPVFAKEVIQVKPEHVVVEQVDNEDESFIMQWLERDTEDRRLLAKQLQQLYVTLSGRR
jgi:hypothetical protein